MNVMIYKYLEIYFRAGSQSRLYSFGLDLEGEKSNSSVIIIKTN
ncbi:hypothetical protein HanRHA438_Chr17g0817931 [Helianthus annuus]|nr:hypothetical protein HanRHA438_Chr17g0817931 [Helianthus annuus]